MSTSIDPWFGAELAGYRIESLVGQGGMGLVYLAWDARLKRHVAVKLITPELSRSEGFRERFLAESELAASLEHPNVVPIHDAGEADGRLYLVMRFVEGSDLRTLLAREGPLHPARALAICSQLADALDAAHASGLVHRDVKPSNVLLDANEHVYLADFGLARELADTAPITGDGRSVGTPAYVAPEQIRGDDPGAAADQYALACVLYECLTGETPFPRERELAVLFAHLDEEPPAANSRRPELPEAVDAVLERALAKDPVARFGSCAELTASAREALGLRDVVLVRERKPLLLAALGLLTAAAAAAALLLALGDETPKPDLTVTENSLVRIDPHTNEVTAVTKVGRSPQAVATAGETVWVYNTEDGTVSAVDARSGSVVETVSVSGTPPSFDFSHPLAAEADEAWIVSSLEGEGLLTHLRRNLTYQPEYPLHANPVSVAVGEGAVWVAASGTNSNEVLRINPRTGAVLGRTHLPRGQSAKPVWIATGEGGVWVTDFGDDFGEPATLYRLDPRSGHVTGQAELPCDFDCFPVVDVGAGGVWVSIHDPAGAGPTLIRWDPRTLEQTGVLHAASSAAVGDLAVGEGAVWWTGTDGTVRRIDVRTARLAATVRLRPSRQGLVHHPYATAAGSGSVWITVSGGGS